MLLLSHIISSCVLLVLVVLGFLSLSSLRRIKSYFLSFTRQILWLFCWLGITLPPSFISILFSTKQYIRDSLLRETVSQIMPCISQCSYIAAWNSFFLWSLLLTGNRDWKELIVSSCLFVKHLLVSPILVCSSSLQLVWARVCVAN